MVPLPISSITIILLLLIQQLSCRDHRNKDYRKKPRLPRKEITSHQIAWAGYRADLNCPLDTRNALGITWSKDGLEINDGEDTRLDFSENNLRLTISNSDEEDSGVYECLAAYGNGPERHTVTLTVVDPDKAQGELANIWKKVLELDNGDQNLLGNAPMFTSRHQDKKSFRKVSMGDRLRLRCDASGTPPAKFQWLKNGKTVPNVPDYQQQDVHARSRTYTLEDLQKGDSGNYTCVVSNYFGSINYTYSVEVDTCVLENPTIVSTAPTLSKVPLNGQVSLECIVENCRERPNIMWFKQEPGAKTTFDMELMGDYNPVHNCKEATPHTVANQYRCDFRITNFTANDAGIYACYVRNKLLKTDFRRSVIELDTRSDKVREHATMTYLYYTLGAIAALVVICIIAACCCVYCGRQQPEKDVFLSQKSSTSTFKRQTAPDYIVAGRHPSHDLVGQQYGVNICGSPPSPPSGKCRTGGHPHHALRDPLLENCSPDHSMVKYDGVATEYEEVVDDLSVSDYYPPHPPSFVSGYVQSERLYPCR